MFLVLIFAFKCDSDQQRPFFLADDVQPFAVPFKTEAAAFPSGQMPAELGQSFLVEGGDGGKVRFSAAQIGFDKAGLVVAE